MNYWMVVNMKNKNALITNAMLASYINEKHTDYLGMIEPFVTKLLPTTVNTLINVEELSNKVNEEYGIPTKQKIIEKILNRLSKAKNGSLVKRESYHSKHSFYTNTLIDTSKFDKRKERMKELVFFVVERLMDFINENYIRRVTHDEAEKYFIEFLSSYNYDFYSSTEYLTKIQGKENSNSFNYKVAKFILSEYNKQSQGCYYKIKEIQEGYFASLAIYYFCNSTNIDNHNPIKLIDNTSIILDTRILIDVLGLNIISEENSMNELLSLIKENGGTLSTFDYYVDELEGIITKFLYDKNSRLTLDLDFFRRNKTNDTEIDVFRKTLKEKIEKKGINIIYETDYSELISKSDWHIDSLLLRSNMKKFIDYGLGENDFAFENDYKSLETIAFYKIENIKSIFVTSNSGLVYTAKHTFRDKEYQNDIDIVISDIDLTAILWLSNYNPESNLSNLVLLENAYAAICPSKDILKEVLRIIDNKLESDEEEIKNEALLLRYNEHILDDIVEITNNDKANINDNFYSELYNKTKNRIRKEIISDEKVKLENKISNELSEQFEEKYKNKFIQLDEKENSILSKENELKSKINIFQEQQILLESEYDNLKEKNNKLENSYKNIIDSEIKKCKKISNAVSKIFKYSSAIIISIFMLFILYNCIHFAFDIIVSNKNASNILNQSITIIGTILTFFPVEKFCLKYINKLANKLYDYIYSKLYKRSDILNHKDI